MGRRAAVAFAVLAALAVAGPAAAYPYDPARDWRTLETEHFRIHFDAAHDAHARRVAVIAEEAHARIATALDWTPQRPTEVVLVDDVDFPDGFAMPLPHNMIGLYLAPPEPGSFLQVDGLDQWLRTVITHEYTHVVHTDKAAGWPLRLRGIVGRQLVTFPHVYQPLWLVEGLATHFETDAERHVGRGQAAGAAMVLRAEVAAGLRPLAQANLPNRSWPGGQVPYLYGVAFHQFLDDRFGRHAIRAFIDDYAGNLVPFLLGPSMERAFGHDLQTLWYEFERWLHARHTPQLNALRAAGVHAGEPLTAPGAAGRHDGGTLQAMPDGGVYFVADTGLQRPRLAHIDALGNVARLAPLNRGARFSAHPRAGVMIAQPERCGEYRLHYDLFLLAPGARRPVQLTRCARYRDVAWHPAGEALAAVRIDGGRSSLHLVSARGALLQVIADGDDDAVIAQPHWSPDGERLIVVRTRAGEGADLYEVTLADGSWRRLTHDRAYESGPRYTRDGRHVLYSSDLGGINDIRRLDLATGRIDTLTRVETGAFDPSDSPDGVVFLMYGVDGYEVRRLTDGGSDTLPQRAPTPVAGGSGVPVVSDPTVTDAAADPYDPLATILPTAWTPYFFFDTDIAEVGVLLWGRDTLGVHAYTLLPVFDTRRGKPVGSASYTWADRGFASASRWHDATAQGLVQSDNLTLAWRFPYSRVASSWNLFAGTGFERETRLTGPPVRVRDHVAGGAVVFDSAREYRLSVSRQEGRHVRAVVERSIGGSDFAGGAAMLDWREFLHVGGSRVLALRYAHGRAGRRARAYELGGAGTEQYPVLFSDHQGLFNKRRFSLRGYEVHPELVGSEMSIAAAEFRFPLRLVERSPVPLGVERWSGTVFVEAGDAAARGETLRMHGAAGAEVLLDLTLGYRFGTLRLRAGFAHGFDRDAGGADRAYLDIGTSF